MSTKAELDKINKELKRRIIDLNKELNAYKKVDPDNIDHEYNRVGVGVEKTDKGFNIVELRYSEELGTGVVFARHESTPNNQSIALLQQNAIKFLLENIVDQMEDRL